MTESATANGTLGRTPPDRLVQDFASRGLVILAPEDLGIALPIHEVVYRKQKEAFAAGRYITAAVVPEILDVIAAPGLVSACNRLLGENWAIVPFTHNTPFASGARDQHWHKDDNGPYNLRRHRHHHAVQVEMLYYPQAVRSDMGPTAVVPYSQYWTFNHEENHDNFAGADHLDFTYQIDGMERVPASGPESPYEEVDIVARRTAHDVRMRAAVRDTGWPLMRPFEVAPLRAGSVVLYSHNLFHRGNHRRDDWRSWKERPRFMWRFWLYRTTEPNGEAPEEVDWAGLATDPLTGQNLRAAPRCATVLWRHHHHWLHAGRPPPARECRRDAQRLARQLHARHDAAEPERLGAAYALASWADVSTALEVLEAALRSEREAVRRAATYGLVAVGPAAAEVLLRAVSSPVKWVRKAGVAGLGDAAPPTAEVLDAVAARLAEDPSVYVRSAAAVALGCLGRRAIARRRGESIVPASLEAIAGSLERERNRLGMNIAQGRSIKFVRPTDECDVCEGIGINYGVDRFKRVRSAVRENALWSAVVLCSHGPAVLGDALPSAVDALERVVRSDENVFCVGLALDALNRLARVGDGGQGRSPLRMELQDRVAALLVELPIQSWESMLRGGMDAATARACRAVEISRP